MDQEFQDLGETGATFEVSARNYAAVGTGRGIINPSCDNGREEQDAAN